MKFALSALSLSSTTTLFVALVSFAIIYVLRSRRKSLVFSKIPQPNNKLPVLGHSLLLWKKGVDVTESSFEAFYKYAVEFHKYGLYGFELIFQPTVHIFAPDHFKKLMTSTRHINKSTGYYALLPWLGTGLIVSGGEKWHRDRKLLTPAFHVQVLDLFNPLINKHAMILCNKIRTTLNYQFMNCVHTLSSCALDTICETSLGVDMETQTTGENLFSKSLSEFSKLVLKRSLNTLYNRSDWLYGMTSDGQKSKQVIKNMHDFTANIITQRKKEIASSDGIAKKKSKSLLDLMLSINLNGGDFSLDDIRFQLDNFTFAGHDTVANALAFILMCLANYTDIQQRVRAEISQIVADNESEISSEHLPNFFYLEMVIKETLRLYPPVPFTARYLFEDFRIGDYVIPKGTDVWLNYYALHRNPDYWTEPDKFAPERFSIQNSKNRHPFAFVPFSGGLRNCIGQRYAKAFLKIMIAQIVRQFEIVPVTQIDNLKLLLEMTIKTKEPIQLSFKPLSSQFQKKLF